MPTNKKRKVVEIEWVQENFFDKITPENAAECLPVALELWQQKTGSIPVPTLSSGSLSPAEVFEIFDLNYDDEVRYVLEKHELFTVPLELELSFTKYKRVVGGTSRPNEALSRCFINVMIFQCLIDEHLTLESNTSVPTSESSTTRHTTPPSKPEFSSSRDTPVPMNVFFETELKQLVTFRGKQYLLSGIPNYSLGYKTEDTTISNNLVIVEAKRRWAMESAYGQLLSYMGMIHRSRKQNKRNAIVYGVATDGFSYHFWRIDNDSNVSESSSYDWHQDFYRETMYSFFRTIIRTAILTSPTTSPIKATDPQPQFPSQHPKLDFGMIEQWDKAFTTEDDPDVELVELPRVNYGNLL